MKIYDLTHLSHDFEQSFCHCKFFTTFIKLHNIMWKDTDSLQIFMSNKLYELNDMLFFQTIIFLHIYIPIYTDRIVD